MTNLRSMKVDLYLKERALDNSTKLLRFFKRSSGANIEATREIEHTIRSLKFQISELENKIKKAEVKRKGK